MSPQRLQVGGFCPVVELAWGGLVINEFVPNYIYRACTPEIPDNRQLLYTDPILYHDIYFYVCK